MRPTGLQVPGDKVRACIINVRQNDNGGQYRSTPECSTIGHSWNGEHQFQWGLLRQYREDQSEVWRVHMGWGDQETPLVVRVYEEDQKWLLEKGAKGIRKELRALGRSYIVSRNSFIFVFILLHLNLYFTHFWLNFHLFPTICMDFPKLNKIKFLDRFL